MNYYMKDNLTFILGGLLNKNCDTCLAIRARNRSNIRYSATQQKKFNTCGGGGGRKKRYAVVGQFSRRRKIFPVSS